jgi:outer membrane biogenesis lipoprotein LolB
MKKNSVLMLVLVLVGVAGLLLSGCAAPGLTKKEVDRRHQDAIQNDLWQLQDDIDAVFLFDRPGRLSDKMVR